MLARTMYPLLHSKSNPASREAALGPEKMSPGAT